MKLSFYRAITGKYNFCKITDKQIFEGVSDQMLRESGIFCNNYSYAQRNGVTCGPKAIYDRWVPGLPVFLNLNEAETWIRFKRYLEKPAIVEVEATLGSIFGEDKKIKLVRNHAEQKFDFEPSEDVVRKHILGEKKIAGECYIQGVDCELQDVISKFTRIYRPAQLTDERKYLREMGLVDVKI